MRKKIIAAFLVTGMGIVFVWGLEVFFWLTYENRIIPNVVVGGVNIGGLSPSLAGEKIQQKVIEKGEITLRYSGSEWKKSFKELGVNYNLNKTLDKAKVLGRGVNWWQNTKDRWLAIKQEKSITLDLDIDQDKLTNSLQTNRIRPVCDSFVKDREERAGKIASGYV